MYNTSPTVFQNEQPKPNSLEAKWQNIKPNLSERSQNLKMYNLKKAKSQNVQPKPCSFSKCTTQANQF